ncbi:FkbM family methyltransferase [bacterium]|nr:FkbM family methyltransferase [bacterium]
MAYTQIFNTDVFNVGNKSARNVLASTDQGLMIVNRFDFDQEEVGHSRWLLDHGNCNTIEVNDCYQAIRNITNPIVFDVGANIGTISIWLSKILKLGHIYSFEPQRQIFYQLAGNVALNNLYNIDVFNYAVGSTNTFIRVKEPNYFNNNDFGTFSLIEEKVPVTEKDLIVPCITLDYFVETYRIPRVDLLKIDVEGMDLDVLKGSVNILEHFAPAVFVEHFDNRKSQLEELQSFLREFNYSFDLRKNNLLCLK